MSSFTRPELHNCALVTIDVQGEVLDGQPLEIPGSSAALHANLTRLGVSTLAFCGFNFPNCPRTSIYQASERDFRVVLATDAVSGLYERGREELADIGVGLVTAGELIDSLSRSPAGAAVNG